MNEQQLREILCLNGIMFVQKQWENSQRKKREKSPLMEIVSSAITLHYLVYSTGYVCTLQNTSTHPHLYFECSHPSSTES